MTTLFDQCWQMWDSNPHNDVAQEERAWFKELNQAVFSGLEKNLAGRVKVYPVSTPAFLYVAPGGDRHAACVNTYRLLLPTVPFPEQVVAAIEQLDALVSQGDTVVFYWLLAPECVIDLDRAPNRRHLSVRMRVLPVGCSPV